MFPIMLEKDIKEPRLMEHDGFNMKVISAII